MSESKEQQAVIEYAQHIPELRETIFAVPNGAYLAGDARRRGIQIDRLKREGLRPGVFDLVLPEPVLFRPMQSGEAFGLFLEMKTKTGRVSDEQDEWGRKMTDRGYEARVAFGLDAAIEILDGYVKRIREARGKE